ncbi:MAG: type II toxin-antitoxin system RelE/ParE family toxin [Candidatus Heimdallarchaeota archaeon]|nr:type II toxin-antitoxin system RelE/ParE family toxin [Candidatus Heimdallarchaeota archaeon]
MKENYIILVFSWAQLSLLSKLKKIKENPGIGKPMRYFRKGTRELYIRPFRLSYTYFKDKNIIYILDIYHKKKQ